jgi:hypothetical protein
MHYLISLIELELFVCLAEEEEEYQPRWIRLGARPRAHAETRPGQAPDQKGEGSEAKAGHEARGEKAGSRRGKRPKRAENQGQEGQENRKWL